MSMKAAPPGYNSSLALVAKAKAGSCAGPLPAARSLRSERLQYSFEFCLTDLHSLLESRHGKGLGKACAARVSYLGAKKGSDRRGPPRSLEGGFSDVGERSRVKRTCRMGYMPSQGVVLDRGIAGGIG